MSKEKDTSNSFTRAQVVSWMEGLDEKEIVEIAEEATKRKMGCLFREGEAVSAHIWAHHEELHNEIQERDAKIEMLKKDKEQLMGDLRLARAGQMVAPPPATPAKVDVSKRGLEPTELARLKQAVALIGSQAEFARHHNLTASSISRLICGHQMSTFVVHNVNAAVNRTIVNNAELNG